MLQVDSIGSYICTIVDICTGLGMAKSRSRPNQKLTIFMLWSRISAYGIPQLIQSDQQTYFTGKIVQRLAKYLYIMCKFHPAYKPMGAGSIERFNGLLKVKLIMHKDRLFTEALTKAIFELNNRPRTNKKSPIGEVLSMQTDTDYPT